MHRHDSTAYPEQRADGRRANQNSNPDQEIGGHDTSAEHPERCRCADCRTWRRLDVGYWQLVSAIENDPMALHSAERAGLAQLPVVVLPDGRVW